MAAFVVMSAMLLVGCQSTPTPTSTSTQTAIPTATPKASAAPTIEIEATPTPTFTPIPTLDVQVGRSIVLVMAREPRELDAWSPACDDSPEASPCSDFSSDSLTWIDGQEFVLVPGSGTRAWEQLSSDRWRFFLREGVRFHNGEPYNAQAAKVAIDLSGNLAQRTHSYGFTGTLRGEVVDDLTIDVVCVKPCPVLPRNTTFLRFQAPQWYKEASEIERARTTVGFGPYRIVDWRVEQHIEMEAYDDYVPVPGVFEMQKPLIRQVTQLTQVDPEVRVAMVATQVADWAADIDLDSIDDVPTFKVGGTGEVFTLVLDTIWHPELKKREVRQALAHSIDCQAIVDAVNQGLTSCRGNIGIPGTSGITRGNSFPYRFDPELARSLLKEANYDPQNEIVHYILPGILRQNVKITGVIAGFMADAGFNVRVEEVSRGRWLEIRDTGPGQYREKPLEAANLSPPPPTRASTHIYQDLFSIVTLDYGTTALQALSCRSITSKVCQPSSLEPKIERVAVAEGEERKRLLEELATIAHDQVYYVPLYDNIQVYGMSRELVWQPRFDGRIRLNTMRFVR